MEPNEMLQMFQNFGFMGYYPGSTSPDPTQLTYKSEETTMTDLTSQIDSHAELIAARILWGAENLITATNSVTNDEYREFVGRTLIKPDDLEPYLYLGLQSEIGEVRQVLCKSLRPGYNLEKAANDLLSELSDCHYWHTAIKILGYPPLTDPVYDTCIRLLGADTLRDFNHQKLMNRKNTTGSFTK